MSGYLTPPPWTEHALCSQTDPEAYFPKKGANGNLLKRVRDICDACPVKQDCLDTALANGISHGIWGGTTGKERRRMPGWVTNRTPAGEQDAA